MVEVPLIVDAETGVNDMLGRDVPALPSSSTSPMIRGQQPIDAQGGAGGLQMERNGAPPESTPTPGRGFPKSRRFR